MNVSIPHNISSVLVISVLSLNSDFSKKGVQIEKKSR